MADAAEELTVAQVAEVLNLSGGAVRARIRSGALEGRKSARGWLIPVASVLESQGVSHGVAVYLCKFLTPNLRKDFREIVYETGHEILEEGLERLAGVTELERTLGRKEAELDAAREEIQRLTGDLEALATELRNTGSRRLDRQGG